ncbi:cupin [candidate division Kazan bacterium RIFCSPHIGHO2_01_FULL_49_10]|uniref:Cupin n=1 Tax=candidate division Kazan bacterium RIFCSPLOWO2_01_FULL_48_13 TaxID=1798539 RepID=A0A1F4PPJ0_UNCK3|nr:MAG: cupin [candidate division Kazan bacterium RIFCSPHIGHO2_01_FULL_49_10]OGB85591.1 MAG: cupin [candidate division Kazan bacterium RIFCSPLOWO2_01_FULL_48_13]
MKGYAIDLEKETVTNTDFRRVLYTGRHTQLVLMTLQPGEDIGAEIHHDIDQFFRFDEGEGKVVIDGVDHMVSDGFGVIIPAGSDHNVINTSTDKPLKFYTLYSPPEHIDGTIRTTKTQAMLKPEEFDGITTE